MGLEKRGPAPSSRMALAWTLGTIEGLAILELGSMGHTIYHEKHLAMAGARSRAYMVSTHLDEKAIALGETKALKKAILGLDQEEQVSCMAILPSSSGEVTGTDLEGVLWELEMDHSLQTPLVVLEKGGLNHSIDQAIEEGLFQIVRVVLESMKEGPGRDRQPRGSTYNLLGAVVDEGYSQERLEWVKRLMVARGYKTSACVLSAEASIQSIQGMVDQALNVVLRPQALKTAYYLQENFGMPFLDLSEDWAGWEAKG